MKLIVAGGGTGGHIFPGIAVAKKFMSLNKENKVLYVGSKSGMEAEIVPKHDIDIELLPLGGIVGKNIFVKIINLIKVLKAVFSSINIIEAFKPDVVLGVGGYASYPTILAARLKGVPAAILEQNTVAGLANRILGLFAGKIYLAFKFTEVYFKKSKVIVTGNPLREEILKIGLFKRNPDSKTSIFIFGGSQGASKINEAVIDALGLLKDRLSKLRFYHQTGNRDFEKVQKAYEKHECDADVFIFTDDMASYFEKSDLLISRSGSGICEIMAVGLPSILVPYPNSAYDHQEINAKIMEEAGAAVKILNKDFTAETLAKKLCELLDKPEDLKNMGQKALKLSKPKADETIVNSLTEIAQE